MSIHFIRNTTIEPIFGPEGYSYSDYNAVHTSDKAAQFVVWLYFLPPDKAEGALIGEIGSYLGAIGNIYRDLAPHQTLVVVSPAPFFQVNYEIRSDGVQKALKDFDTGIADLAGGRPNLKYLDLEDFFRSAAGERINWKHFFLSRMQLHPKLHAPFKKWLLNGISALLHQRKKVLVLDLDNTLWAGILGEDGPEGIKMAGDYPGNAFRWFQAQLCALKSKGILLAVCSKNNLGDVEEVWENHPDLLLKKEDFAACRINWEHKAHNIAAIAQELNVGLDSLVFLDDSPTERALVREMLPEVYVPEFPGQAYEIPTFFSGLVNDCFLAYSLTKEDLEKTRQYLENARRDAFQQTVSYETFIQSLEIELTISRVNKFSLARVAQLTQKTNQFNLTTRRYSEPDIEAMAQAGHQVFTLDVRDRFGEYGLTGVAICRPEGNNGWQIDSFLLSCRILGKQIESAFLYEVLSFLKRNGASKVGAAYLPSPKNQQTATFFDTVGFTRISSGEGSSDQRIYIRDLDTFAPDEQGKFKIHFS
ncbi:MAG: hypothetical protein RL386_786 [Bacteroidota bacterium]|jgi:FkbH-like protein